MQGRTPLEMRSSSDIDSRIHHLSLIPRPEAKKESDCRETLVMN